jgi:ribonuclease HI
VKRLWIKARFKEDEVLARCDAAGGLMSSEGLVPFCYRLGGKTYSTRLDRIQPMADAVPVVEEGEASTQSAAVKQGEKSHSSKAGGMTIGSEPRPDAEAVQLWTDGACTGNPGPAGLGVLFRYQGVERECSEYLGHATNNIAELTAIKRGLEMVPERSLPIDVMTDSSYCIGLLTKGWKAKANQELVANIRVLLSSFSDVRFIKVRGHAGIEDNERADELARAGVTQGVLTTSINGC